MDIVKVIGAGFISTIIIILIKEYRPEFTIYVSLICGTIIFALIVDKISSIINIINIITSKTKMNTEYINILLKITGIAILSEYAVSICKDTGETAIANKIDFASKIIIISLSIPIIAALLELIIKILP